MSEAKRSSTTVFIIAGAAIGLCCVGSFAGMMLFGIASPVALLRGRETVLIGGVGIGEASAVDAPESAIVGAWKQGTNGISELNDRNAPGWSTLQTEGRHFVFRANHSCESEALTRSESADCITWQLTSRGNCEWAIVGNQLTMKFGPGTQLSKVCGKEFAESALPAMTIKVFVRYEDELKRLLMTVGDEKQEYTREP